MEKFVEVVNKRGRIIDWVDYNKAIKLTTDDPGPRTALKEDELSNKHLRITRLNNGKFVLISSKDPLGNDSKAIILTKKETVSALQLWNATDEAQKNYKQFVHNYYKTRKIKSLIIILLIISVFPASYFTGIFIQNDDQPASISTTGNDAKLYLQSDQFDNILIEIDYVNGREPNNGSLDELVTFFKKTCDKDRIWYEWSDIIIPENDNANTTYSSDDLRDIEERYRDNYKLGSTIVIYIIYSPL